MDKKVYIMGGAQTDFERNWTKEGKNMIALLKEAVEDGFKDAEFTFDEMVALNKDNRVAAFVGNFIAEQYISQGHLGAFLTEVNPAFYGVPSARYEAACASSSVALDAAITKIEAGEYDVCIVVGWEIMKSVDSKKGGDILGRAAYYEKEGKGIDLPFPKLFGRLADATIEKYGLDKERYLNALAKISCINYANAKRNPLAQTRKWFMSYEEATHRGTESNPNVGGLLGVSDCSQVTDGAAVVILCSEKYAQEKGLKDKTFVKGYGHRTAPLLFDKKIADNANSEYVLPWTRQACLDAYKRAGLTVDDIDVFETHDCFSSSEFAAISAFGISEPGKECEAVENGVIAFDGAKPINPSGGLIGCGHPVGASGARMFVDLYKQVTGKAGRYQVEGAKNGMMLNIGGSATTNYVFIVSKESPVIKGTYLYRVRKDSDFEDYFSIKNDPTAILWSGFASGPDKEQLHEHFDNLLKEIEKKEKFLVYMKDAETGDLIGYDLMTKMDDETVESSGHSILSIWQGKGMGTILFTHLVQYAKELGFRYFTGWVSDQNVGSIKNIERNGFVKTEESRKVHLSAFDRDDIFHKYVCVL